MNLTLPVSVNNALFSGGSRPSDEGGGGEGRSPRSGDKGGVGGSHPDPEIRGGGWGAVIQIQR